MKRRLVKGLLADALVAALLPVAAAAAPRSATEGIELVSPPCVTGERLRIEIGVFWPSAEVRDGILHVNVAYTSKGSTVLAGEIQTDGTWGSGDIWSWDLILPLGGPSQSEWDDWGRVEVSTSGVVTGDDIARRKGGWSPC